MYVCFISFVANVLFCHLKRFEFDLELLRKVKVNDRYEFPTELNMKPYTKEGMGCPSLGSSNVSYRTEKYYSYNLVGLVVHTGTADSGHYYSLVEVRNDKTADINDKKEGWFCFNDSIVTPFDPNTLESATFGGPNQAGKNESKSYSAYLLIYEREDYHKFDEQLQQRKNISVKESAFMIDRNMNNTVKKV